MPNSSARSAQNFWGVGWFPLNDVGQLPQGAKAARCKQTLAAGGQPPAYNYCDSLDVLVSAGRSGPKRVTADSALTGLERVGPLSRAGFTRLHYSPERSDGVVVARSFRYVRSCSCLRYTLVAHSVS